MGKGRHFNDMLGCADRDELEWAAWITVYPTYINGPRKGLQQGQNWAPTSMIKNIECFFVAKR